MLNIRNNRTQKQNKTYKRERAEQTTTHTKRQRLKSQTKQKKLLFYIVIL